MLEFLQYKGKMDEGKMRMIDVWLLKDECVVRMQNLGGRLVLILIRVFWFV